MKPNSLRYLLGQGVSGLWKNRLMTFASIGVLTACLLIVGFAVLLTENINKMVGFVESQNEMTAFMYQNGEQEEFLSPEADVNQINQETALEIQTDFRASGKAEEDFRQQLFDSGMTKAELEILFGSQTIAEYVPANEAMPEASAEGAPAEENTQPEENAGSAADSPGEETPAAKNEAKLAAELHEKNIPIVYWNHLAEQVQSDLSAIPNVSEVRFVSKAEGLETQKESFGDLSYLLDNYSGSENPIRNMFVIQVKDLAQMNETREAVNAVEGIKIVNAADSVATTLTSFRNIINIVGWTIVAALSIVSLVIIVNTIRASIFARRKELNIMRYVGATNAFIRIPFIIEGVCLGLLAAGLAYLIVWLGYSYFMQSFMNTASAWLQAMFQSTIPFRQISVKLAGFFLASGVGIGVLGSMLSIRNHIKV